jgi:hypothetical protein
MRRIVYPAQEQDQGSRSEYGPSDDPRVTFQTDAIELSLDRRIKVNTDSQVLEARSAARTASSTRRDVSLG